MLERLSKIPEEAIYNVKPRGREIRQLAGGLCVLIGVNLAQVEHEAVDENRRLGDG